MSFIPPEIARAIYEDKMKKKLYQAVEYDTELKNYVDDLYGREKFLAVTLILFMSCVLAGILFSQTCPLL